jgi:hypothetical protein
MSEHGCVYVISILEYMIKILMKRQVVGDYVLHCMVRTLYLGLSMTSTGRDIVRETSSE